MHGDGKRRRLHRETFVQAHFVCQGVFTLPGGSLYANASIVKEATEGVATGGEPASRPAPAAQSRRGGSWVAAPFLRVDSARYPRASDLRASGLVVGETGFEPATARPPAGLAERPMRPSRVAAVSGVPATEI
jgi:hypothetical protein